jgi:hypothetical protein
MEKQRDILEGFLQKGKYNAVHHGDRGRVQEDDEGKA